MNRACIDSNRPLAQQTSVDTDRAAIPGGVHGGSSARRGQEYSGCAHNKNALCECAPQGRPSVRGRGVDQRRVPTRHFRPPPTQHYCVHRRQRSSRVIFPAPPSTLVADDSVVWNSNYITIALIGPCALSQQVIGTRATPSSWSGDTHCALPKHGRSKLCY